MVDATKSDSSSPAVGETETTPDGVHEKAWWQSKKFVAFLATELGLFVLMGAMIYEQDVGKLGDNVTFMVLAVTAGFLAASYIGGQALVDKYVRVAAITMGKSAGAPAKPKETASVSSS